jgi:hypothetical protein
MTIFKRRPGERRETGISDAATRRRVRPRCGGQEEKSGQREPRNADRLTELGWRKLTARATALEVQLQSELELSRVVRRSRPAVVMAVAGALIEGVYVGKERRRGCFVKTIEEVKAFSN